MLPAAVELSSRPHSQTGSILLEALVALVVMAAGLLGLAALQSRVIGSGSSAYYRSIASDIASDLADRVAANSSPYKGSVSGITAAPNYSAITCTGAGTSATATGIPACGNASDTGTTAMADADLVSFYKSLQQLPGGHATLTSSSGFYSVTITWNDNNQATTGDTSGATASFTTTFIKPN